MIDLQASQPTFFYTYSDLPAHMHFKEVYSNGDDIWLSSTLPSVATSETSISFDAPDDWDGYENLTLQFLPDSDGNWHWRHSDKKYVAVRSDSKTHIILVGTWQEESWVGGFVAAFPKAKGSEEDR